MASSYRLLARNNTIIASNRAPIVSRNLHHSINVLCRLETDTHCRGIFGETPNHGALVVKSVSSSDEPSSDPPHVQESAIKSQLVLWRILIGLSVPDDLFPHAQVEPVGPAFSFPAREHVHSPARRWSSSDSSASRQEKFSGHGSYCMSIEHRRYDSQSLPSRNCSAEQLAFRMSTLPPRRRPTVLSAKHQAYKQRRKPTQPPSRPQQVAGTAELVDAMTYAGWYNLEKLAVRAVVEISGGKALIKKILRGSMKGRSKE